MSVLHQAGLFLGAAVVVVPLFKRLGLGSVLGYLAAGLVLGPSGIGLVGDVEEVLHFAEFGVVLLLFLVGLELEPARLWKMRSEVFGLGLVQVAATTALLATAAAAFGLPLPAALVVGFGFALSSTAIALQTLAERREIGADHGRVTFGILLFQDLAAIPVLALLPALAGGAAIAAGAAHGAETGAAGGADWTKVAAIVGVFGGLILASRVLLRPLFRWVASTHINELFTATALLVAVGVALLMEAVGLSMALGTFLAGVLLADSEYRHELEADIEPFKGLLLGLFFMAVGMSVQAATALKQPVLVVTLVLGLVAVKAFVLFAIARFWRKLPPESAVSVAVIASQGSEFAFVLFRLAEGHRVLSPETNALLVVVIGLSMVVTPFLVLAYDRVLKPRLARSAPQREYDASTKDEVPVIIAGFGRVGQVVGRILRARHVRFTALDASSEHIDFMQKFGTKIYYGDASRLDLLRAAQAERAKIFVLAIDDVEASMRTAETVKKHFPHLQIYARARNRQHAYRLLALGVDRIFRETFDSSIAMAGDLLEQGLGYTHSDAQITLDRFREFDINLLQSSFEHHKDIDRLQELARRSIKELEELFEKDETQASG